MIFQTNIENIKQFNYNELIEDLFHLIVIHGKYLS